MVQEQRDESSLRRQRHKQLWWITGGSLANPVNNQRKIQQSTITRPTQQTYRDSDTIVYHSDMANTFRCKYCGRIFPSMQGHRSHLTQAKRCHEKWQTNLDTMPIPSHLIRAPHRGHDGDQTAGGEPIDDDLNVATDDPYFPDGPTVEERQPPSHIDDDPNAATDDPYFPDGLPPIHDGTSTEDHSDNAFGLSPEPRWREHFPHPAGQGIRREATAFESLRDDLQARGGSIWGTFLDDGDWKLAKWILDSGATHASIDKLLDLKKVSQIKCFVESKHDLLEHCRFETAAARHSTTADRSSKRLMLCRQGQSGLVNCSRLRETFLMKAVHPERRRWNFGAEILLNAFVN